MNIGHTVRVDPKKKLFFVFPAKITAQSAKLIREIKNKRIL